MWWFLASLGLGGWWVFAAPNDSTTVFQIQTRTFTTSAHPSPPPSLTSHLSPLTIHSTAPPPPFLDTAPLTTHPASGPRAETVPVSGPPHHSTPPPLLARPFATVYPALPCTPHGTRPITHPSAQGISVQ
ncbi:hypothetical protein C7974DRAFT_398892 [Boeremia exigua]|uniref:uncharacterized protein n=1 Tax=Boeremia exigua TaxID=749465 RepID=UPI001E8DE64C|nr:uncharacterized protein C7974DRAFT_398892 [Boeremia exigua]KAH6620095.1 hypothetical protein C7974DRAFT_398892 [Boeremia exigua]